MCCIVSIILFLVCLETRGSIRSFGNLVCKKLVVPGTNCYTFPGIPVCATSLFFQLWKTKCHVFTVGEPFFRKICFNECITAVLTWHMRMYVAVSMVTQCWLYKLHLAHSLKSQSQTVYALILIFLSLLIVTLSVLLNIIQVSVYCEVIKCIHIWNLLISCWTDIWHILAWYIVCSTGRYVALLPNCNSINLS